MPSRHKDKLAHLHNDQPEKPPAFRLKKTDLMDAIFAGRRRHDKRLEKGYQKEETAENPLHDSVNSLHSELGRSHVAIVHRLHVVPLSDVELKEGSVDEVGCRGEESQLKGELKAFCHILSR